MRDEALALVGWDFEQTGMDLNDLAIDHILVDDSHAMVLLETMVTLGGRRQTSQYVDVYRLHDGKATEDWQCPSISGPRNRSLLADASATPNGAERWGRHAG